MGTSSIVEPGRNCWRVESASRAAVLVDGESYFSSVRAAIAAARRSVYVLGWDIDSRLRLVPGGAGDGLPEPLGEFLNAVVSRRHGLQIYVLAWDFAMIYALEREWLPVYKLGWRTHRRVHFRMDGRHPVGASHHQKVVVIDDRIAFCGGIDLGKWRWDTSAHRSDEPRRVDPDGKAYPPFHDVQMLVDGEAAVALAELARWRWERCTGHRPRSPQTENHDPWPRQVEPDMRDVRVAIARTLPEYRGEEEVRESEALYLDAIRSARRWIYIESQYLTCNAVGEALVKRLVERDGPEVVIVTPHFTGGWLEQTTMDVLRFRLLKRLRAADEHDRLRVFFPTVPGLDGDAISVHAKVMIVDGEFLRVGSSNLSNRSMGLDTECDLAVENGEGALAVALRLLAEHLGRRVGEVGAELERTGSLMQTIDSLNGAGRRLEPLVGSVPERIEREVPDSALIDPERPVKPDELVAMFVPTDAREPASRRGLQFAAVFAALLALAAAWRWTPLGEWLSMDHLLSIFEAVAGNPLAPLAVITAFVIGGLIAVPVTLMITATALLYGSFAGFALAMAGSLASALVAYLVGQLTGRGFVQRFGGRRINRLSRRLAKRGILAMVTVRIVPVAPFTVINLVAGASHISLRDYLIGTALGMLPGVFMISFFVDRLLEAVRRPGAGTLAVLAFAALILIFGSFAFRAWARRRGARRDHDRARP